MNARIRLAAAFPWVVACAVSTSTAAAPTAPAAVAPRHYALISAVGSTFTLVRQKKQTGSSLGGSQRIERDIPGVALEAAVLRGLERIVLEDDPTAGFTYLKLNPVELQGAHRYERGEVAIGKLATALERMPERNSWHRILVVTPRYMNSGRDGMGDKLHGIGVYVQPAEKLPPNQEDYARNEDETRGPDGAPGRSSRYLAPYFYAQVWVIDPATLRVLETSERWDFQKLFDPASTSNNVEDHFPPAALAAQVERFVELSTANALREAIGTVTVSEPRIVPTPR